MKTAITIPFSERRILVLVGWVSAALVAIAAMLFTTPAWSDDTEVFLSTYGAGGASGRPKVLIVFDTSGSMGTDVISVNDCGSPSLTRSNCRSGGAALVRLSENT